MDKGTYKIVFIDRTWDNEQKIINAVKDADAIIVQKARITKKVIESLEKCRVISLYGVGLDSVDVEAATEHGIIIANVPDYCINEVVDHTMALILSSLRKTVQQTIAIRRLDPKKDYSNMKFGDPLFAPIFKLKGQILGLVGFGNVSQNLVQKARPFGFEIIAHDPIADKSIFRKYGVTRVSLEDIIEKSDVISLHLPLNETTEGLIGAEEFARMKKTAFLINAARGSIVDEDALYTALKTKQIAGAALDVTVDEPIKADSPLLELENLIITNHIGYYSEGCFEEVRTKAYNEVYRVLSGKNPRPVAFVNPQVKCRQGDG